MCSVYSDRDRLVEKMDRSIETATGTARRGVCRRHKRCFWRGRRERGRWDWEKGPVMPGEWPKARENGRLQGARVGKAALELTMRCLVDVLAEVLEHGRFSLG